MSSSRVRHAARPLMAAARAVPARRAAEVIVVTHDAELERTLRAALPTTPILTAATPAALADHLLSGDAGALVLDAGALDAAAIMVARHLAEQFPDVPLVAVGSREDEARLAGLISTGLVYRFLHRPLSAARARTLIDAALRRGGEIGSGARPPSVRAPQPAARRPGHRHAFVLVAVGVATVVGVAAWMLFRHAPAPRLTRDAPVASAAAPMQTPLPASPVAPAAPAAIQAVTGEPVTDGATGVQDSLAPRPSDRAAPVEAPLSMPAGAREEPTAPGEARETMPIAAVASDSAPEAGAPSPVALPDPRTDLPLPPGPDPAAATADPPSPPPGSG